MSTLNLGLQCLGLMQEKGDSNFEAEAAKCNSLVALHDDADHVLNFRSSALDSMACQVTPNYASWEIGTHGEKIFFLCLLYRS